MPSEIVEYKSSTAHAIALFATAIIWVLIGAEQAYITLASIIVDPSEWLLLSTIIVITMIPAVALISYNWKKQVIFTEPTWEFRIREVEFSEFEKVMKDYKRAYSFLMCQTNYFMLFLLIITCSLSILFPFVFPFSIPFLIWGPYFFAGLILVSLFLLAIFVFRATPNSATPYFRTYPIKSLRKLVDKLWDTTGISWSGVRLTIGQSSGYYLIQEAKAVGRIEGIESVGAIECDKIDKSRYTATSVLQFGSVDDAITLSYDSDSLTIQELDLNDLVKRTLIKYIDLKGVNELLKDIIQDLGITLSDEQKTDVLMSEKNNTTDESEVVDGQ
jgi:hypothetical protein